MALHRSSPCKVNLLLNILARRPDGFHELETVMQPVPIWDHLLFERSATGIDLRCTNPDLPVDGTNLVHRAASLFLERTEIRDGVRIHLDKRLPLAAGLGGGSANAAITLDVLNEMFGLPLPRERLVRLAAELGSDVPFFLQNGPALARGRGERVEPLAPFELLRGAGILLVHPGFGVSTRWAYQALAAFPEALHGRSGRAEELIRVLRGRDWAPLGGELYNALEAPVLRKHPLLAVIQESMRSEGLPAVLMSGSGSTTFALTPQPESAKGVADRLRDRLGNAAWIATAIFPDG